MTLVNVSKRYAITLFLSAIIDFYFIVPQPNLQCSFV